MFDRLSPRTQEEHIYVCHASRYFYRDLSRVLSASTWQACWVLCYRAAINAPIPKVWNQLCDSVGYGQVVYLDAPILRKPYV